MKRLLLIVVVLASVARAEVSVEAAEEGPHEAVDIVTLTDESVLRGRIVAEDDTLVVLETLLGRIEIPRDRIRLIERVRSSGRRDYEGNPDPDTNTVFFTPTPETLGDGRYFRNFLLFFLNYGISVHDDVDLSFGTIFPISSDLGSISAGLKWRLLSRSEQPVGLALVANGTIIDDYRSATVGGVVGIGNDDRSLNVAVGRYLERDREDDVTVVLVGADLRLGGQTKFLIEYGTSSEVIEDDVNGLINFGFRWFNEQLSFTLTGFRPLEEAGSLVLLPFTMFSVHF